METPPRLVSNDSWRKKKRVVPFGEFSCWICTHLKSKAIPTVAKHYLLQWVGKSHKLQNLRLRFRTSEKKNWLWKVSKNDFLYQKNLEIKCRIPKNDCVENLAPLKYCYFWVFMLNFRGYIYMEESQFWIKNRPSLQHHLRLDYFTVEKDGLEPRLRKCSCTNAIKCSSIPSLQLTNRPWK